MNQSVPSHISSLRYYTQIYIEKRLKEAGIEEISSSHGSVIYALLNHEQMRMKDLAKVIQRDKSTLTVLMKKLLRFGYVEMMNSSEDKRVKYVRLTEKGKGIRDVFLKVSEDLNHQLWKNISSKQGDVFISVLHQMINNIREERE